MICCSLEDFQTEIIDGEDCLDVESAEKVEGFSWKSNGIVNEKGKDDCPLLALKDRIRSINPHAPIILTNFCKVDPGAWLSIPAFSRDKLLEKEPDFLQSDGPDHVRDDTVSSVSWSFLGLELKVNKLQA